jgi:DNA-binding Lrp family transcriptional regulator
MKTSTYSLRNERVMDKLDKCILSELFKDAQLSFAKIAKKLGTSPYTIRKRYEKMKKEGIIESCIVGIDLSKIGYQGKAFLFVTLSPERDKIVTASEIMKIRNVFLVVELVGPFDILVMAAVIDLNGIRKIINEVKNLPDVQRVEIAVINDTAFPINPSYGEVTSRNIRVS